jgi:branched-chain amino acid transport system substrate-binding protein
MTSFVPAGRRTARRILVAAMALGLAGCRSHAPVRIGVVIGGEGVAGARIAASEINATGGIHGRLLDLRVMAKGGATRASVALAAAESLAGDPSVIGIVGHANSAASLSGAQIYNARHVLQIAPTSSAPLLTRAGPYTFRLVASDIHQARFLADEVLAGNPAPRIAMFFVNDDYGHALHEEVRARFSHANVPVVFDAPYAEDTLRDVAAIARAVANGRPDLLVWLGRAPQLRQLLPTLRLAMPALQIVASDGIDNATTERNADGALTGVRFVCFVDPSALRPPLSDLRARFRAMTGLPLTAEAALTYDAVMLMATSARAAGTERDAIRGYVASIGTQRPPYSGATGVIAFDANGDPRPSYCLGEITGHGTRILSGNHPG